MVLCQCVVTLRVWHLFHRSRFIRWLAAAVFISSMIGTAIVGGFSFHDVKNAYEITNSSSGSPPVLFTIYLPSLIVHTVMFSLTMYRFRASSGALQEHGIIHRFLKEGMFMYAFAAGTLLYEIISLSMTKPDDISVSFIYYPALGGGLAVGTTVVSVCRAMLSIRSLAATHHVDPVWLLNHAELSRVPWRRGASEGEIYVEVDALEVFPLGD
ncbi:hypothetical protein F4604DRAFT_1842606 [Suillus subluteus]|nr:hypothetical protein F4604DRAFT_1842606 [Suillus subluteus]